MKAPAPVFLDPSGRRWRRIRTGSLVVGILTTAMLLVLAGTLLFPPLLPRLDLGAPTTDPVPDRRVRSGAARPLSPRRERERRAARQRLFEQLRAHPAVPSRRYAEMPLPRGRGRVDSPAAASTSGNPIVAGFYVNWDDNSFTSFKAHVADLDWVIGEWVFLGRGGGNHARCELLYARQEPVRCRPTAKDRPRVFAMVSNFDGRKFDAVPLRRLLATPASREAAAVPSSSPCRIRVRRHHDRFRGGPRRPAERHARLHAHPPRRARTGRPPAHLGGRGEHRRDARAPLRGRERLPVPDALRRALRQRRSRPGGEPVVVPLELARSPAWVPPGKSILALGAYGYDWNEAGPAATEITFQDAMVRARAHDAAIQFDSVSLNRTSRTPTAPTISSWYLDGVTAWNQARAGTALGAAGTAIWRLGSEDPSIWHALVTTCRKATRACSRSGTATISTSRAGGLLRIEAHPSDGRRLLRPIP